MGVKDNLTDVSFDAQSTGRILASHFYESLGRGHAKVALIEAGDAARAFHGAALYCQDNPNCAPDDHTWFAYLYQTMHAISVTDPATWAPRQEAAA